MALNFPNSPTNGQVYTDVSTGNRWAWDSANTCWKSTSAFTQSITIAASAPGSPVVGQLWWNQEYGRLLVYYNDGTSTQWVDASPSDYTSTQAFNQSNNSYAMANASFNMANAAYITANLAIATANTVTPAFNRANTALQNTTGTFSGTLTVTGNIIMGGGTSVGYLTIPQNAQTSAYILVASDTGKHISITTGGVTVNASVFSIGDTVVIYNNSGSNQTITQGTNVTLRLSGTATTGNRTLAQYGTATLLCVTGGANPVFVVSGSGLS